MPAGTTGPFISSALMPWAPRPGGRVTVGSTRSGSSVILTVGVAALLVDFRLRIALALGVALLLCFSRRTGWLERFRKSPSLAGPDFLLRSSDPFPDIAAGQRRCRPIRRTVRPRHSHRPASSPGQPVSPPVRCSTPGRKPGRQPRDCDRHRQTAPAFRWRSLANCPARGYCWRVCAAPETCPNVRALARRLGSADQIRTSPPSDAPSAPQAKVGFNDYGPEKIAIKPSRVSGRLPD